MARLCQLFKNRLHILLGFTDSRERVGELPCWRGENAAGGRPSKSGVIKRVLLQSVDSGSVMVTGQSTLQS